MQSSPLKPISAEAKALAFKLWDDGKSVGLIASIIKKKFGGDHDRQSILRLLKAGARTRRNGQKAPGAVIKKGGNLFTGPDEIVRANNRGRRAPADTVNAVIDHPDGACRWPLGDPLEPGFAFCPNKKAIGQPAYCPLHAKRSILVIKENV